MTVITWIGIELSARTQVLLLGAELLTLGLFAVIALYQVYTGMWADSVKPTLEWFNPFLIPDASALTAGLILAIFIYWGWDSTVTVNEESEDSTEGPGKAAIVSTLILLGIYLLVSTAAQAVHGIDFLTLEEHTGDVLGALGTDVLGSPLDKLLVIAVLTSAAASTQTTILPTARTLLSMGAKKAVPAYWARINPRYLTPEPATLWMGALSIIWYVGLKLVSENILYDAIAALGLMIAFYYGLTGFACAIYYRYELLKSVKSFLFIGVLPVTGALILTFALVKSIIDLSDPANSASGESWFGVGPS
jgi:amino acid transporter